MSLFVREINCNLDGNLHNWDYRAHKGKWKTHGKGFMNYRVCNKCQLVEYIKFTNEEGKVTFDRQVLIDNGLAKSFGL